MKTGSGVDSVVVSPRGGTSTDQSIPTYRPASVLSRRAGPILITLVFVVLGMAYMLAWNIVVHHSDSWATGGDLWGIFRGAHYVGWGDIGGIYTNGTGVVAFPGMEVLLAPVAMLIGALHLTESATPYFLARPSAALILQPIELLATASVIFASDALAEAFQVPRRRRLWVCIAVAVVAWPVGAMWGHAEDALAVTFAMYAMIAMRKEKWAAMGWLFGLGIVMQPLVALTLPLFVGASPRGQRLLLAVRAAALSAILVGVAFLGDAADTYRQLVQQPTPPSVNHATPWVALAPKLNSGRVTTVRGISLVPGLGHAAGKAFTGTASQVVQVAGGPGRMIDVILALLLGVLVWRRPQPSIRILWLAGAVLASRCFFEPVMTPYYLAPPLIMCLVMASRQRGKRFWPALILALEITIFAYHRLSPWAWWLPIVAGLVGILALAYPGGRVPSDGQSDSSGEESSAVGDRSSQGDEDLDRADGSETDGRLPEPALL